VTEIRAVLATIGLLRESGPVVDADYDADTETAVRTFQQSRGLSVDGMVGDETWRDLEAARWRLGQRTLYQAVSEPLVGDDVRQLQERLLEMGYDVGRADGVYGGSTARAVAQFQREVASPRTARCVSSTRGWCGSRWLASS